MILGLILYLILESNKFGLNLLGDFYGGSVASIWSLAGLFFIYVAFLGQKQQILNQQLEIMFSQLEVKYTRLELVGQKKEMIEQNQTLRRQRFDNTFFQLLRNHQEIVNGIDLRKKNVNGGDTFLAAQGRDCFKTFYTNFKAKIGVDQVLEDTLKEYMDFYHKHQSDLGHYYRNLYHILKYIKCSDEIEEDDKFMYSSLLRALLSSHELAMLFYNGLGDFGKSHFKPLMEEYSLLKNIDKSLIINKEHLSHYDQLVFASSEERKDILDKRKKTAANIS